MILSTPKQFIKIVERLPKSVYLRFDMNLETEESGEDLARLAYKKGFKKISIHSGYLDDEDKKRLNFCEVVGSKTMPISL